MMFTVLSSLETVHDTVQYRCCIVSLLYRLLRIRIKVRTPYFHTYERDRKQTATVQCSVQCTIVTLYNAGNAGPSSRAV